MSMNFKTCLFGGFDREDVIAFIEQSARESQERISELERENNELRMIGTQQEEELAQLRCRTQEQSEELTDCREWKERLEQLESRSRKLEEETQQLRAQAQEYQSLKDHIAEIEISAHRRTEEFRAQTIASLRKTMATQLAWCEKSRDQYRELSEQFARKLYQAQQTLATPDLSGFDEMKHELQELDESFDR